MSEACATGAARRPSLRTRRIAASCASSSRAALRPRPLRPQTPPPRARERAVGSSTRLGWERDREQKREGGAEDEVVAPRESVPPRADVAAMWVAGAAPSRWAAARAAVARVADAALLRPSPLALRFAEPPPRPSSSPRTHVSAARARPHRCRHCFLPRPPLEALVVMPVVVVVAARPPREVEVVGQQIEVEVEVEEVEEKPGPWKPALGQPLEQRPELEPEKKEQEEEEAAMAAESPRRQTPRPLRRH